ncbi:MAG: MurR/RpiR family transcriptional regulator [Collinsella aerofaciens]
MFRDRLLSAGKSATCYSSTEAQVRTALASDSGHAAIVISYSGLAPNLKEILPILSSRHVPVVVIGTPYCARLHPGFAAYLTVSDHESMTHRITQFASHIAVQYVLDSLYSSYFAKDYARCAEFLERSFPYTRLPGLK